MSLAPAKVATRIAAGIKRFQPILASAKTRDVNESDTVVIVTDVLHDLFGYDKYSEITSEHSIRGTFCDLAVKLDGALAFLIEVKAVGMALKDGFVKQAIDYAANQGVDWVVLTNGILWRVYKVSFAKPISHELVVEFNLLEASPRNEAHVDMAFLLSKEGWKRSRLGDYHLQKEALSRFSMAALILSDPILEVLRRELRRVTPGLRVEIAEVRTVLEGEVLKRDVLEGDRATAAKRAINRAANKTLRQSRVAASESQSSTAERISAVVEDPELTH
jgi:hypothetical protein